MILFVQLVVLPSCDGVIVNVFRDFFCHGLAQLVLYVSKHLRGVKDLISGIGTLETVFGSDIADKPHAHGHGQLGLGRVTVLGDGHRRYFIAGYFAFNLQITTFVVDQQTGLPLVEVPDFLAEHIAELRINKCRIIREVRYGNGLGCAVVDAGAVELIRHGAAA